MRAPVSRSRPLRLLPAPRNGSATRSPAGATGGRGRTGATRAGVSRRVAELARGSVADQGLKRDVVARPGRSQCHVSVLRTADRRQAGPDERLERHHVRLAPGAFRELDGRARPPALWARKSRTGPIAQTMSMAIGFSPSTAIGSLRRRPSFLPTGGHEFSPRPGGVSDRRRGGSPSGPAAAAMVALSRFQARGFTPLPAVACASR
jgi:hypothetical protein